MRGAVLWCRLRVRGRVGGAGGSIMHGVLQAYMLVNVGVVAYVVGTFTLVVTKDDEAAGARRALARDLRNFVASNNLAEKRGCGPLVDEMYKHVEYYLHDNKARPSPSCMPCMHARAARRVPTARQHPGPPRGVLQAPSCMPHMRVCG
jgi:hypothetical protein